MIHDGIVAGEDWQPGDPLYRGEMNPAGDGYGWADGNHARYLLQVIEDACWCDSDEDGTPNICNFADAAHWQPNGDGGLGDLYYFNDFGYEPNSDVEPEQIEEWRRICER